MTANLDHLRFPLVVAEGLDVSFYGSIEALGRQLEAIDVRDEVYVAYDSEGRLLELGVSPPTKTRRFLGLKLDITGIQFVVVEGAEAHPTHDAELRQVLLDFLEAIGEGADLHGESLSELVDRASARAGVTS